MEFRYNINKLLPKGINKITHTLLPEDFRGDRRELLECQRQLTKVVDEMGEASAKAQGLSKPITSAQKLKDTDHHLYLMVDSKGNNGLGSVIGLLKTGSKNLFMFDEGGIHYQSQPRCILDFYIHESRQRMGLGNALYQHMLTEENIRPIKLAIDRPSEKFLAFLRKHYGLTSVIPQNNKFVVFSGFFDDEIEDVKTSRYGISPRQSIDSRASNNNDNHSSARSNNSINGTPMMRSAYGRYAAARPPCHMANIIHNTTMFGQPTERTGQRSASPAKTERPRSLSLYQEEEKREIERAGRQADVQSIGSVEANDEPDEPEAKEAGKEAESNAILPTPNGSSQTTPSCGQEISGNQPAHLDLKFYHSPLW